MKRFLSLLVLFALLSSFAPLAFAKDGEDGEDELDMQEIETLTEEENHESNHESNHEEENEDEDEIEDEELDDSLEEEFHDIAHSGNFPDQMYVSVVWGNFSDATGLEPSVWDGSVAFDGAIGRPKSLLGFERGEDALNNDKSNKMETAFASTIHSSTDGILFKVKANLDTDTPKLTFTSAYQSFSFTLDLKSLLSGSEVIMKAANAYEVHVKLLAHEDWLKERSEDETRNGERFKPHDAEKGAWYEKYMNYALDEDFFGGYRDDKGELTGKIGPGDSLTRFQAIKVMYALSTRLDMGVGARGCDPATVTQTTTTSWMGEHWARGYVQCIENSDVKLTLLNDVIKDDLANGEQPTLRWESMVTGFEMLQLEATDVKTEAFADLKDSKLNAAFQAMIEKAGQLEVISGYPDGTFKPERAVNRAEMFKIVTLFYEVLSF